jgi:hypothetical protein
MLQFFKHLNNGYDPMLILGRGALGYRPPRQMIGRRVQERYRPFRAIFGRGGGDEEDEEDEEVGYGGGGEEPIKSVAKYQPTYINAFIEDIQNTTTPDDLETLKDSITDYFITSKINKDEDAILLKMINDKKSDLEHKLSQQKLQVYTQTKKNYKDSLKAIGDNLILIVNKTNNLKTQNYANDLKIKGFKQAIEDALKIPTEGVKDFTITQGNNYITDWLNYLNELSENKKPPVVYSIVNNELISEIIETEPKVKGEFEDNLTITLAEKIRDDYWAAIGGIPTKLKTDPDYGTKFNDMIKHINKTTLLDEPMDDKSSEFKPYLDLRKKIPVPKKQDGPDIEPEPNIKKYMTSIIVKGKPYFLNDDDIPDEELILKEYNSPGKPSEFCICGPDNKLAKKIYNVDHPNMQVTDYIAMNYLPEDKEYLGKQFCIDNVDTSNRIFSEMKYYEPINYVSQYNINIQLKEVYIDMLKVDLRTYIEQYISSEDKKTKKDIMDNINAIYNVLSDKKEFNKDFYKYRRYMGVGITMNKFNPIVFPDNFDFSDRIEGENFKLKLERVKASQGQLFAPIMTNRKITKIVMVTPKATPEVRSEFNKNFNKFLKISESNPYIFDITTVFNKGVGVYPYSDDDLVKNDFILGVYQSAYAFDDRKRIHYNAVLIPIEKFILEK